MALSRAGGEPSPEEIVEERDFGARGRQLELQDAVATAPEGPAQGLDRTPLFAAEAVGAGPQPSRGPSAGRDRGLGSETGIAPPDRTEGDPYISRRGRGQD